MVAFSYALNFMLNISKFVIDADSFGAFASVFGTLYGIVAAMVLLEVWEKFKKTSELIDQEAQSIERLFGLATYFKDAKLRERIKNSVKNYINLIEKDGFKTLAQGKRERESSRAFRRIANAIKDVKFKYDHDEVVFHQLIEHLNNLYATRTERINSSLVRLPTPLKVFLYSTSMLAIATSLLLPFSNLYYGMLTVGAISFVIYMLVQIINEIDNPFVGFWTLTTEPFARAWHHIEEDY